MFWERSRVYPAGHTAAAIPFVMSADIIGDDGLHQWFRSVFRPTRWSA
jgi:hypothetical protein